MKIKRVEYNKEKGFRVFGPIACYHGEWPLRTMPDEEVDKSTFLCRKDSNVFCSYVNYANGEPYVDDVLRKTIVFVEDLHEFYLIGLGNES